MAEALMRIKDSIVTIALAALVVLFQYSLWFGKGGWLTVWRRQSELNAWLAYNATLVKRNSRLAAEVDNLLHGQDVMIERARYRLGLVRPDEVFYYVYDKKN